ncbi:uncharacterized protein T551_03584 [Pneumocystis jirovecii RU7]|uniref:Nucleolar 27S pre-rRNA processing Urb2/Npa2 C-terminal domain-containing protein n=1 Tax=Pneumocystis jirovecii (strain RU7) TaxID=1408657 RepID=A0A0W4ZD07_PNEJ7|nr:uncharacterized protein T551_03584 [Pneumocystis jirovecii RU7]KTW26285.1 hypothetical protein T551_03584 [Pneumocystis jirovecii RU7]
MYGFENFKNVSEIVASRILPYVCYIVGKNDAPSWINDLFSIILHKTLFSPESLINYINFQTSNSESKSMISKVSNLELFLDCLLKNLTDISYHSNVLLSLPKLLEIAQNSLGCNSIYSKVKINLNSSKMARLTDMFLSEILKLAIKLSAEDALKYLTISDILELSKNIGGYHKLFVVLEQQMLEILEKSFSLIKDREDNIITIGWKLLYNLLKIDSELILPYNEQLWLSLCEVDITSEYSKICFKVIRIFVNNYKSHRNLHKFINDWIKFLKFPLNNDCILLSDEILTIVMELTNNLSLNQIRTIIDDILKENNFKVLEKPIYLNQKNDLFSKHLSSLNISKNKVKSSFFVFYPLLSIIQESVDISIIRDISKDLVKLYESILIKVFSNISFFFNDPGIYLIFRIHYKAMQLSYEYISLTDPYKTLEYIKSITMFKGLESKITFYTILCQLVYMQYFDQCASEEFKTKDLLSLTDLVLDHILFYLENASINSFWKAGKIQLINSTNISIAYIYIINNQWLYLINKLSFFDKIRKIMNFLLKYSIQNTSGDSDINEMLTFSNLWYIYLSNAEIYELDLFRDASLFVLMDYIFSNKIDKLLLLNNIESYCNKKMHKSFKTKINNFDILEFKKLIKYIQIIPINCIEDSTKEKLLDFLFYKDFQFTTKQCLIDIVIENRKLLYRIMVTTNTLNSMLYNIFPLIYLYLSLDNIKVKNESLNIISNLISKEILRKKIFSDNFLINKLVEVIENYHVDLFDYYHKFLYQQIEYEFYIPGIIQLILILSFEIQDGFKYSNHNLFKKKITQLIKFYFKAIKKCLKILLQFFQKNDLSFEKILNSVYLFQFFFQLSFSVSFKIHDKDLLKQLIFFISKVCFYYENINSHLHKKSQDLLLFLLKTYCNKAENYDDILEICVALIAIFKNMQLSYTDEFKISNYSNFQSLSIYYFIQKRLQSLEFQDFKKICTILSCSFWETENINMVANILSAILLIRIEKENKLREKYSEYLELFQTTIFRLILIAKRTTDLEVLYNFINLFNILLLKKSYFSLQNLDQLFVIIVKSLSPFSLLKTSSDITIDDICEGFCKMISLIIKKNYKRLSKRYHLLTICFQSLLHLFFYKNMDTKMIKNSIFQRRPSWILPSSSCSISSVKIYSDTLLSWIKTLHLNKDKKLNLGLSKTSEKTISKYLLWIIIEYIKLLLYCSINKEVKDILTLLIMEIFKVLSKYEFEMINNTLDNHGKIIFKKLYDDYIQYDKWNER